MLPKKLITSKGNEIILDSRNKATISHLENPTSYVDTIIDQINNQGVWDFYFKHPLVINRKDLVILDVGANIGLFSLFAQDSAEIIIAIEPTPDHVTILEEFIQPYFNIIILQEAIHWQPSEIDFYISDENSTMNSSINKYGTIIKVPARTLPQIITSAKLDHVDFCKVDIEGSEFFAVNENIIKECHGIIKNWHIEVHATPIGSIQDNIAYFLAIFNNNGYVATQISYDGIFATEKKYII